MESNAIRLGSKIEKVTIDFADLESLKKSSGFSRLYTIHTAKTNQMSQKLGFHVGGFCDDRGKGGSAFAAYLVGYDSLPSDAILCKMDSQYEYLPFNQEELDSLFDLLNDG
ncbi:MAG: hypothetical protein J5736_04945, partial [Bacilli bacterium]|nr:hypothetical protein [Bacilli bacterium]